MTKNQTGTPTKSRIQTIMIKTMLTALVTVRIPNESTGMDIETQTEIEITNLMTVVTIIA